MRNPFCGHYPACLDRAARTDSVFDCAGCLHESDMSGYVPDEATLTGCLALMEMLSQSEARFKRYLAASGKNLRRPEAEIQEIFD